MSTTETFLVFVLGMAVAMLVFLLFGRTLWSLMGSWTSWREAAQAPMAMQTVQAERDRLKAERAMMAQKLEVTVADVKMRMAEQTAELSRNRNRMLGLEQTIAERDTSITQLENQIAVMEGDIRQLQMQIEGNISSLNTASLKSAERESEYASLQNILKDTQVAVLQRDDMIRNLQDVVNAQHDKITMLTRVEQGDAFVANHMPAAPVPPPIVQLGEMPPAPLSTPFPMPVVQPLPANNTSDVVRAARGLLAQSTEVDNSASNVLTLAERVRKVKFGSKA
jgi:hypothetical protein